MGNGSSSDVTSEAGHGRPADGFLHFLRELSLSAVVAGAVVSVGLMLHARYLKTYSREAPYSRSGIVAVD